ncbi:MAG: zinc ABC transporter substrate-binding protein [Holosporaceae bacterium]|nr:MAG: zinc ABC transporter substrate-binding protein [Holosporaceae bacterium]
MKLHSYIFLFLFMWPTLVLSKIQAVTTFTVLEDFVKRIGGDRIEITNLVPSDSDPHIYEPTPQDVKKISKADLIFYKRLRF